MCPVAFLRRSCDLDVTDEGSGRTFSVIVMAWTAILGIGTINIVICLAWFLLFWKQF
jgi:hypothetical protein